MAVLFVLCTLFWLGILPFPIKKEFAREAEPVQYVPCLEKSAQQADLSTISVRVYNASDIEGLAGTVSQLLTDGQVSVTETSNWAGDPIENSAVIYTSKGGVTNAYTLRAFIPRAKVIYDPTLVGNQVDVVLGGEWDDQLDMVSAPDEDAFKTAMTEIKNCTPIEDLPEEAKAEK